MKNEVLEFYNNFAQKLAYDKEINHKRYQFVRHLAESLIDSNATVLDLGCGIGTTSAILAEYAKEVVAIDFAPKLLEIAPQQHNIIYHCMDIAQFDLGKTFEFICLFDVLEHITSTKLRDVFDCVSKHVADNGIILIIVPYYKYLDHKRIHYPESIQLIDNSLKLEDFLAYAKIANLEIVKFEVLSLFNYSDYVHIRIAKDKPYE